MLTADWIREHTAPDAVLLHEKGPVMELMTGRRSYTWRNLPGDWPEGCPPVDWAFYGPQDKFPKLRRAFTRQAVEQLELPVPRLGQVAAVRIHRMR
jgi:hypothetical protein